jgi:ribosomal-protein-alanine N-acetyltransferase
VTDARPVEPLGLTIEWIDAARDLDAILDVDRACFSNPWTRAMYEQDLANTAVSRICVGRLGEATIVAYCSFWLVLDEIHINNLAVRPEHRGRGYGRALVEFALRAGSAQGAASATLEVRRSNTPARRLYAGLGFVETGVRHNYYTLPVEDALVLWRRDIPGRRVALQILESDTDT